jgi:hypothetical protein
MQMDLQIDFIKIHPLSRPISRKMTQQLITPSIISHIRGEVMERDTPALNLAHPEPLALAQKPFSQSFSSLRIDGWAVERGERVNEVECGGVAGCGAGRMACVERGGRGG